MTAFVRFYANIQIILSPILLSKRFEGDCYGNDE